MYVHEALAASSAWANGRGFQNRVPNSVHTSSLHHIIDQAFPIFQRATLKNTGRPGYEASTGYHAGVHRSTVVFNVT